MDLHAAVSLPCALGVAHRELETLDGYPSWLSIVSGIRAADPDPRDDGPAWWVDLGAGVGPLRLRKRVRMVRVANTEVRVRFERRETDGGDHHAWTLDVQLTAAPDGTAMSTGVEIALHYGGSLPPLVDRFLAGEVGRAGPRLIRRVAAVG